MIDTYNRGGNGREIETAMVEVNGEAIEERLQYMVVGQIIILNRRTGEVEGDLEVLSDCIANSDGVL